MQIGSTIKLAVALAAMGAVTLLMALNKIGADAGMSVITLVCGYILGNGVASLQGKPVASIIESKEITAVKVDEPAG